MCLTLQILLFKINFKIPLSISIFFTQEMDTIIIVAVVVIIAVIFDYLNGFHDAANALATTVSTRALSPKKALILGVTFQFIGAVSVVNITMLFANIPFFKPVTDTIGKIVALPHIEDVLQSGQIFSLEFLALIVSIGLISAIIWNIVTWFFGIPSSSSHALIGGICGSAFMAFGISAMKFNVILSAILSLVISPIIAILFCFILMKFLLFIMRGRSSKVGEKFKRMQIFSSALFAFSQGANDGQKTAGIITMFLISAGMWNLQHGTIYPPLCVIVLCSSAIAAGIGTGGWRIMKTVGTKIFEMKYMHGFNAQAGSTAIVLGNSFIGLPVSTAHVLLMAVVGTGAATRMSAVRWNVIRPILTAWVITIPSSFIVSAIIYFLIANLFNFPIIKF